MSASTSMLPEREASFGTPILPHRIRFYSDLSLNILGKFQPMQGKPMVNSETKQSKIRISIGLNWLSRCFMAMAALILFLMSSAFANAQQNQVLRIHAIVNDDVISFYDLIQRIRLVILTSSINDSLETRRRLAPVSYTHLTLPTICSV